MSGFCAHEQRANALPFSVADPPLPLAREEDGLAERGASRPHAPSLLRSPCGLTAGCHSLVGPPKAGPSQPERPLLALHTQRQDQAAHFGYGKRNAV
jgi:hypothetical protein